MSRTLKAAIRKAVQEEYRGRIKLRVAERSFGTWPAGRPTYNCIEMVTNPKQLCALSDTVPLKYAQLPSEDWLVLELWVYQTDHLGNENLFDQVYAYIKHGKLIGVHSCHHQDRNLLRRLLSEDSTGVL